MHWTLSYGLLMAPGLIVVAWFALGAPSARRVHERKPALVQNRLAGRTRKPLPVW